MPSIVNSRVIDSHRMLSLIFANLLYSAIQT